MVAYGFVTQLRAKYVIPTDEMQDALTHLLNEWREAWAKREAL